MTRKATAFEQIDSPLPGRNTSRSIADSWSIPAFFVLSFLSTFVLSTGVYFLYAWCHTEGVTAGWTAGILLQAALHCLPAVTVSSIFLIFFRLHRRPGIKAVSLFLLGFSAVLLFYGVWVGMYTLKDKTAGGNSLDRGVVSISAGHIHILDEGIVYAERVDGNDLAGVVIRGNEEDSIFSAFTSGRYDPDSRAIRAAGSAVAGGVTEPKLDSYTGSSGVQRDSISMQPSNPFFDPLLAPPDSLEALLHDAQVLYQGISYAYEEMRQIFWFSIIALVVYSLGSLSLFEMTHWPLFNLLVSFVAFRALFWFYGLAGSTYGLELAETLGGKTLGAAMAPGLLFLCGIVFLCLDIVIFSHRSVGRDS